MHPEILVFGLSIKMFGLMFAFGFLAAGAVIHRRLRELGHPVDWAYEWVFAALIGGLVGARGMWMLENLDEVRGDVLGSIFSGSGLVWYGGVLGGAAAVLWWARRKGWPLVETLDIAAVPLALGNAIGRIGCQLSGDGDYGKVWNGPWAMGYPHGTVPTDPGVTVHPTPIYETLAMGLVAWLLWSLRDVVRPGVLFASWLLLTGTERLLVEFLRINDRVLLGLTVPQLQSIAMMIAGAIWIAVVIRRHGSVRRADAQPASAHAVPAA